MMQVQGLDIRWSCLWGQHVISRQSPSRQGRVVWQAMHTGSALQHAFRPGRGPGKVIAVNHVAVPSL